MISDDDSADAGVSCGIELRRYARAVLDRDPVRIASAAGAVRSEIGGLALGRAAGVVAFFDAINRVADATGVELDEYVNVPAELDLSRMSRAQA